MNLRIAEPADAEAIARLHAQSWRVAYRGMYSDAYLDGDVFSDRLAVWQGRFETRADSQHWLLATDGDALLGFAWSIGAYDERWGTLVDNLHVRLDQQGRGIGRTLLGATAAWSRERYPDAPMHLWVLDGNTKARRFYESLGGRPEESEVSEAPGGGSILGWRYVWPTLDALLLHAPPQ